MGCLCCDPAPSPQVVDCSSNQAIQDAVTGWASWQETPNGLAVLLNLSIYFAENLEFADNATVEGGTLVGSALLLQDATFELQPDDGATSITLTIPISCGEATHTVSAVLDVSATPEALSSVPVGVTVQ